MLKLKNLLFEASITGQAPNTESLGGYKGFFKLSEMEAYKTVSYTHLRAHETS